MDFILKYDMNGAALMSNSSLESVPQTGSN